MDRLLRLEPSNLVPIRVEPGQRWTGELTLRNVMHTMPVAFRLDPANRARYTVRPQSGIIPPLGTATVEITYVPSPGASLPESYPKCLDSFLLHSVVAPGAPAARKDKDRDSHHDPVPPDWFTAKRKQVFTDSAIRVAFVGSAVLARLVSDGSMDEIREALERSDPEWRAADSVDRTTGEPLLQLAIARGRPDLVQLILEFDPDIDQPAARTGRSPLEAAAAAGDALTAELLLARRASTDRSAKSNFGPVHVAAAHGHAEVLRLLILKNADLDAQAADGRTALHLAVERGRRDCARMLLSAGCRADVRGGTEGGTPLHAAAAAGDEWMVRLILKKARFGVKQIRDGSGRTAFDAAAERGYANLYDVLRMGDELAAAARKGESADVIEKIVDAGADVGGRDQNGWTTLMRAAFKGWTNVVRVLLDKGAEVDAADAEGYTALHCAAGAGQVEAAEMLVKRGADVGRTTRKGVTAMEIAAAMGYAGVQRVLVQGGAAPAENAGGINDDGSVRKMRPPAAFQKSYSREKELPRLGGAKKKATAPRSKTAKKWSAGTVPIACSH